MPVFEAGVAQSDDEREELLEVLNLREQRLSNLPRGSVENLEVFLCGSIPNLHRAGHLLGIQRRERTLDPLRDRAGHLRARLPDVRVGFEVLDELRQVFRSATSLSEDFLPARIEFLALLERLVVRVDLFHANEALLHRVDVAEPDELVVLEPSAVTILGERLLVSLELLLELFGELLDPLLALRDNLRDDARPRHRLPVHARHLLIERRPVEGPLERLAQRGAGVQVSL